MPKPPTARFALAAATSLHKQAASTAPSCVHTNASDTVRPLCCLIARSLLCKFLCFPFYFLFFICYFLFFYFLNIRLQKFYKFNMPTFPYVCTHRCYCCIVRVKQQKQKNKKKSNGVSVVTLSKFSHCLYKNVDLFISVTCCLSLWSPPPKHRQHTFSLNRFSTAFPLRHCLGRPFGHSVVTIVAEILCHRGQRMVCCHYFQYLCFVFRFFTFCRFLYGKMMLFMLLQRRN